MTDATLDAMSQNEIDALAAGADVLATFPAPQGYSVEVRVNPFFGCQDEARFQVVTVKPGGTDDDSSRAGTVASATTQAGREVRRLTRYRNEL